VYAPALHPNHQPVTADNLPVQAGSYILYILQFLGAAMLQQPEYVNELSSGCRQSLRVISSSFSKSFLPCLLQTCIAFCEMSQMSLAFCNYCNSFSVSFSDFVANVDDCQFA